MVGSGGGVIFIDMQISRSSPDLLDPRIPDALALGTSKVPSSSKDFETLRSSSAGGQELLQRLPRASPSPGCPAFRSHRHPPEVATSNWFRGLGQ